MIPALLGLIAPVAAVKVLSSLARAAGAALRSATAPVSLPSPSVAEKAAEVSEQVSDSPVIFAYDGMSRRTKITELTNGTVTSKKLYWWLGGTIVCERDGLVSGFPITKRYFGQGLVQGVTKLFYTFDHLGSVRELVDDAGTVQQRLHQRRLARAPVPEQHDVPDPISCRSIHAVLTTSRDEKRRSPAG